jgi:hypothetical protein
MTKEEYNRHSHKERLEKDREEISKYVKEFLKSGGKIDQIDRNKTSLDITKANKFSIND